MKQQHLASLIERPEIQDLILGDYDGPYSIGVTADPVRPNRLAISVRVSGEEDDDTVQKIPRQINVDGETVQVLVHSAFRAPSALSN